MLKWSTSATCNACAIFNPNNNRRAQKQPSTMPLWTRRPPTGNAPRGSGRAWCSRWSAGSVPSATTPTGCSGGREPMTGPTKPFLPSFSFFSRCGFSKVGNLPRSRITSNVSSTLTPTDQRWFLIFTPAVVLSSLFSPLQNRPVACPVVVFGPRFKPWLQFVGSDVPLHVSRDLEMPTQS